MLQKSNQIILVGYALRVVMTSKFTRQGQGVVKCNLCEDAVSFFRRRCEINICDPCLPLHLRQKTRYGHDVVKYNSQKEDESYGNTSSASGDFLLCLRKEDQSKVVRYSSAGTMLQEIQFGSHCQPLYQVAWYIDENANEDIVVSDYKKNAVITVNGLGIFRYENSGKHRDFPVPYCFRSAVLFSFFRSSN